MRGINTFQCWDYLSHLLYIQSSSILLNSHLINTNLRSMSQVPNSTHCYHHDCFATGSSPGHGPPGVLALGQTFLLNTVAPSLIHEFIVALVQMNRKLLQVTGQWAGYHRDLRPSNSGRNHWASAQEHCPGALSPPSSWTSLGFNVPLNCLLRNFWNPKIS